MSQNNKVVYQRNEEVLHTSNNPNVTTGITNPYLSSSSISSTPSMSGASQINNPSVVTSTPRVIQETVTRTEEVTKPIQTGPNAVPAHPIITPIVPEGTTILNYPGAAAAGPVLSHPQQLPVGPTSGMQQGTTHDRHMRSTNSNLPASGQDGAIGNYMAPTEGQAVQHQKPKHRWGHVNKMSGPAPGAQQPVRAGNDPNVGGNGPAAVPVLYPTQSVTGGPPVVQQGTYRTTTMSSTSSTYEGDPAIGMYGPRPGNTVAINDYPANRAAYDGVENPRNYENRTTPISNTSNVNNGATVPTQTTTTTTTTMYKNAPSSDVNTLGSTFDKDHIHQEETSYKSRDVDV